MASMAAEHKPFCRQVSIESPKHRVTEQVFTFEVPVPEVPEEGARIRVLCAGVCYRRRDSLSACHRERSDSDASTSSSGSQKQTYGVRNTAVFPGYEVAGIVDAIGERSNNSEVKQGSRVIVYPFDGIAHGYAEFISVPSSAHLVVLPDSIPLPIASMLPTGALWAMNAVFDAKKAFDKIREKRGTDERVRILMVGTGTLALWALRLANHYFGEDKDQVQVTVAALKDEGIAEVAEEYNAPPPASPRFSVVAWSDQLHEAALTERTVNASGGPVDIIIDFGTTTRSLLRGLQCLNKGGTVLIGCEMSEYLNRRLKLQMDDSDAMVKGVAMGTYEQLKELVNLVAEGKIEVPPYTIFPSESAQEAVKRVNRGDVKGHAILQFGEMMEEPEEDASN